MPGYTSIRQEVLDKLEANFAEIADRFGVESLGIFGSVARGEDNRKSDIDVLYTFKPEYDTYDRFFDLSEYLEELFGRRVDLISPAYLKPRIKPSVMRDAIIRTAEKVSV